uniref:Uncharacterized protein n=1 Tax=Ditylenchus dipsaci TaxID=166011 RepID=A0A915E0G3_9BILA
MEESAPRLLSSSNNSQFLVENPAECFTIDVLNEKYSTTKANGLCCIKQMENSRAEKTQGMPMETCRLRSVNLSKNPKVDSKLFERKCSVNTVLEQFRRNGGNKEFLMLPRMPNSQLTHRFVKMEAHKDMIQAQVDKNAISANHLNYSHQYY